MLWEKWRISSRFLLKASSAMQMLAKEKSKALWIRKNLFLFLTIRILKNIKKKQYFESNNCSLILQGLSFFYNNSAHIEILRDNKLQRIQFFYLPICHCLPKERKDEFNQMVNRETTNSKVFDLVSETKKLIKICENEEKLKIYFSQNKIVALFANYVNLWKDIAFLLSLLLNLFIVTSFSTYFGDRMEGERLFLSADIDYKSKFCKLNRFLLIFEQQLKPFLKLVGG